MAADVAMPLAFFTDFHKWTVWLESKNSLKYKGICTIIILGFYALPEGGVMLEYKEKLRNWPLDRQATAYRGMVFEQTQEETVLAGVASQKGINQIYWIFQLYQNKIIMIN